ncbi:MAG: hypothetical protein PHT54_00165 [Candidatus Nanoarchaeia archaeon]|nr:hypothetical protein [Candidatus Nanoarchaeia archaeon]
MISKTNKFNAILIILSLLTVNVSAETSFFDDPDDVFIMSSSTASGITGGATGTGGGGGCTYKWNCTYWSECLSSGNQTRNCTNVGTCSDTYKFPGIERSCDYAAPEIKENRGLENETEEPAFSSPNEEVLDTNKIPIYFVIVLLICFIIFYFKKYYFKKPTKK